MIGRLVGKVVHEDPTGSLVLDVGGVGYELTCPIGSIGRAASDERGHVILFVHTNLRQDALELYGFSALEERAAFRQLTTVPNVGPKLALSVLNVLPAKELALVIDGEDKVKLGKVPGVGKKTAERLVLELRGKLPRHADEVGPGSSAPRMSGSGGLAEKLITALTGLGYKPSEADRAAKALVTDEHGATDLSALLREALKFLAS